ncbi:ribosome-inactivating protein alpha-trichosanthin-like [Momordica charantia]|uniref:rRNA N-glycosylase n=1 Tax=Momordica charantia TaxID=3673 RepID=A0A6J1DRD7_MOMCH|nr:ribosome-inactivating protein alpha-trichosanthin-like [Momordica charantia]
MENMSKFLVFSLLSILATFFLAVEGDVSFRLLGATTKSYKDFIANFRNDLASHKRVYNIRLLSLTVPGPSRYTLVHLYNYDDQTITLAVDVINVYIMGYRNGHVSYFFNEPAAAEASKFVFKDAQRRVTLPFTSNYAGLETAAGKIRERIPLGLPAMNNAITNLVYYDTSPRNAIAAAFLVLIQSTAEAARFQYIEKVIGKDVEKDFLPSEALLSLENNWGALSKQIQIAEKNNGKFKDPVLLTDNQGKKVQINNVSSNVVTANIQLLLNYQQQVLAFDQDIMSSELRLGHGSYVTM